MADETPKLVLEHETLERLGARLGTMFEQYKRDRRLLEDRWLRNLRQFKGEYDPEILKALSPTQSKAYPKLTRKYVIGMVARLMEIYFPQGDSNYSVDPSPIPYIEVSALQMILDKLQAESQDPTQITDEQITKAVRDYAAVRSERMKKRMDDQLESMDYITLARRVIFSAVLYSAGVLKGPMVRTERATMWKRDETGRLVAYETEQEVPFFEVMSVWDFYPDLSAKTLATTDGFFGRHIMTRGGLSSLISRKDFFGDEIKEWLEKHKEGNYREEHWETALRTFSQSDRSNIADLITRKYELWEFWGEVSGHELAACGVDAVKNNLDAMYEAQIWGIGKCIIKGVLNPFSKKTRTMHAFIFEEDDVSLLGAGLPEAIRDSALGVAEAARMTLDNASVVCGPQFEIFQDALMPGTDLSIHAYKTWWRTTESDIPANVPAVRELRVDSHIAELLQIINLFSGFADQESMLPPSMFGDLTRQGGKEAYRTTSGASMLMGAAAMPIRDTVRNLDKMTESAMFALYSWNMDFNPDPEIKGDFSIVAKGSRSLLAKEFRAQSYDYLQQTMTPEERQEIDTRKFLIERMSVRDINKAILRDEEEVKTERAAQAQKAARMEQFAVFQALADIAKTRGSAFKEYALGAKAGADVQTKVFEAVMGALEVEGDGNGGDGEGGGSGASGGSTKDGGK